jgi:hypothetical protein
MVLGHSSRSLGSPLTLSTTKSCAAPDENYRDARWKRQDDIVYVEEAGTFWIWAMPELLGWPAEITWLFSPATGKFPWPGDLWGVDASGELVIVETKASTTRADPFGDFLELEHRRVRGEWTPHTADAIGKHWKSLLAEERVFLEANRGALRAGSGEPSLMSGVVPYSSKRIVTWRWRELYLEHIAPLLESPKYERSAAAALERMSSRSTWSPHYFGLFTIIQSREPAFSRNGQVHYEELQKLVTPVRVHVRTIRCSSGGAPNRVEIACRRPQAE